MATLSLSCFCGGNAGTVMGLIVVKVEVAGRAAVTTAQCCLSWLSSYWANHWASGCPELRRKKKNE